MKQFLIIFKYEYLEYLKNKTYRAITLLAVIAVAIALSWPSLSGAISGKKSNTDSTKPSSKTETIALLDKTGNFNAGYFTAALPNYFWTQMNEDEIKTAVDSGKAEAGVIIEDSLKFKLVLKNSGPDTSLFYEVQSTLSTAAKTAVLVKQGLSEQEAATTLGLLAEGETVDLGKSFEQTYMFSYILLMLMYMSIIIYGQLVAVSVVTEKSSRMMELLITSAKPNSLIFGKVMGGGLAGLTQIGAILASTLIFYQINAASWADSVMIQGIFNVSLSLILYAVLFFILGYFIYSFLYGALGSLTSRVEDINATAMPVIIMLIAAFMISMSGLTNPDSMLLKAASFVPFSSPMAMFLRLSMSEVTTVELLISVGLLVGTTLLIGYLASKIYRVGVLMYGKPPKLSELHKILKNAK